MNNHCHLTTLPPYHLTTLPPYHLIVHRKTQLSRYSLPNLMTKNQKSSETLLTEINEKLNKILGLMAVQNKPRPEQLKILDGLEFSSIEIGKMLGISDGAVRNMLFTAKKRKSKNKKQN